MTMTRATPMMTVYGIIAIATLMDAILELNVAMLVVGMTAGLTVVLLGLAERRDL